MGEAKSSMFSTKAYPKTIDRKGMIFSQDVCIIQSVSCRSRCGGHDGNSEAAHQDGANNHP